MRNFLPFRVATHVLKPVKQGIGTNYFFPNLFLVVLHVCAKLISHPIQLEKFAVYIETFNTFRLKEVSLTLQSLLC